MVFFGEMSIFAEPYGDGCMAKTQEYMTLLIALLICHYLADFCLTSPTMIRAKADGRRLWPIAWHAAIHALLMGVCLLIAGTDIIRTMMLMGFELITHFAIDTLKGRLTARFTVLADQLQKPYWMVYGFDQLLHLLVIVAIVAWG